MFRRYAALIALVVASAVLTACADVTGPKQQPTPKQECTIYSGSSTCV
jgi:hypothetical protein